MLLFTQKACTEAEELGRIWDLNLLAQQHISLPQSNGFWQQKRDSWVKDKAQFIAQSSSSNQGIRVCAAFPSTAPYSATSKGKGYFSCGPVFRGLQRGIPRLLCSEVNLHGLHLEKKKKTLIILCSKQACPLLCSSSNAAYINVPENLVHDTEGPFLNT